MIQCDQMMVTAGV